MYIQMQLDAQPPNQNEKPSSLGQKKQRDENTTIITVMKAACRGTPIKEQGCLTEQFYV